MRVPTHCGAIGAPLSRQLDGAGRIKLASIARYDSSGGTSGMSFTCMSTQAHATHATHVRALHASSWPATTTAVTPWAFAAGMTTRVAAAAVHTHLGRFVPAPHGKDGVEEGTGFKGVRLIILHGAACSREEGRLNSVCACLCVRVCACCANEYTRPSHRGNTRVRPYLGIQG